MDGLITHSGVEGPETPKIRPLFIVGLAQGFLYAPAMPEPYLRCRLPSWSPPAGQNGSRFS